MTKDEFQRRYHDYVTRDGGAAQTEADRVNAEGIEGDSTVAVDFGLLGWGLMLRSAAQLMVDIGLISPLDAS